MRRHSLKKLRVVVVMLLATASWSQAQQEPLTQQETLNRMLVDAGTLIRSAASAPTPEESIRQLEEAQRTLLSIIEDYPSSDAAVQLATGQGIGTISLESVRNAIRAKIQNCWDSPTVFCVARLIVDRVLSDPNSISGWSYEWAALSVLFGLASGQSELGMWGDARKAIEIAADFLRALPPDTRRWVSGSNLNWRGAYLDVPAAMAVADAETSVFSDGATRTQPLEAAVDRVVKATESIEELDDRVEVLHEIASVQREAGNVEAAQALLDRAIEAAESIEDPNDRAPALRNIASEQRRAGNVEAAQALLDRAIEAANANGDWYDRAADLASVANVQADMGDREVARATIQEAQTAVSSRDAYNEALTFTAVGSAQIAAGDTEGARRSLARASQAASSIAYSGIRAQRLSAIVSAAVEAGELTEATRFARLIDDAADRTAALAKVALAQAEVGSLDDARITLDSIREPAVRMDDPVERAHVLADIAAALAAAGDADDARITLEAAIEPAPLIENPVTRGH